MVFDTQDNWSRSEVLAIKHFSAFMRFYLHGSNANCVWTYHLLMHERCHKFAIERAGELLLDFEKAIAEQGESNIQTIINNASKVASPNRSQTILNELAKGLENYQNQKEDDGEP